MSEETEKNSDLTYEELCELYGDPHKHRRPVSKNKNKTEFLYGIIALSATALLYVLTITFYSHPVITMGGATIYGKTVNIFTFIGSAYNKINETASGLANAQAEDILGIFGIVQYAIAFAFSVLVLIIQTVILLKSVVYFFRQNNRLLPYQLLSAVKWNVCVYVVFNFLCNVSGGEGNTYYYIGDIPSVEMDTAMFVGAGSFIACIVLQRLNMRDFIKENALRSKAVKLYLTMAAGFSIWIIYALMPLSKVCEYVVSGSVVSALVAILTNSFSVSSLIFSANNLLILIFSIIIFKKINSRLKRSAKAFFDETEFKYSEAELPKELQKRNKIKKRKGSPLPIFIICALSLTAIALLHIPEIGMGWSVNILPYYIAMTAITLVWLAANAVLTRIVK